MQNPTNLTGKKGKHHVLATNTSETLSLLLKDATRPRVKQICMLTHFLVAWVFFN